MRLYYHDNDSGCQQRNERGLISAVVHLVGLWLAVKKIIHHDDIAFVIVVRTRGFVTGRDPNPRDERLIKHDAKKGEARVARRCRHETAEDPFPIDAEIFDPSAAAVMISTFLASPAAVLLVNVCEDRAETADARWAAPLDPGMKNLASVILLPTGVNRRNGLKALNVSPYVGLLNSPARPFVAPPEGGACESPTPGVVN